MLIKEYRIPLPLSVAEYLIGSLYRRVRGGYDSDSDVARLEFVKKDEPCASAEHGAGRYTELRIHLIPNFPAWVVALLPAAAYVTCKIWSYHPLLIEEFTVSFTSAVRVRIRTNIGDDAGTTHNLLGLSERDLRKREVDVVRIESDAFPPERYKASEDPTVVASSKTGRGPLVAGWWRGGGGDGGTIPVTCAYKCMWVSAGGVPGVSHRIEKWVHRRLRDMILERHRQLVAWTDIWYDMTPDDVHKMEKEMRAAAKDRVTFISDDNNNKIDDNNNTPPP